ncbi:helix-turn-helix domain-containing protein [Lichenicola cladoniae]|uniref:Helix-turn-helix domain-containing protein n=1 Tax=Lichenicola cladoniae TaxID=1484109 RepID=A0A6M8HUI0_9PROT|nr:helix-turn-helix domain-containing protein [Acetobacteraceae bacterium]QKE91906.1 helix-turn-helix domain-containing protein [Lichenicola cladoniae]
MRATQAHLSRTSGFLDSDARSKLLTTTDVASRVGCHPETIRRALRRGDLACYRTRGYTRVFEEQLTTHLERSIQHVTVGAADCSTRKVAQDFQLDRRMQQAFGKR